MGKEGRQTDRVTTSYNVKMSRFTSPSSRFVQAKLVNISRGGCKLKMQDMQTGFAVGEPIVISFNLSDFNIQGGSETLKLEAQVRWAYPDGSEMGCQFKEMEPKLEKQFMQMIEQLTS
jgi:c-di-GMP-binding flagellar brake protein YcgR